MSFDNATGAQKACVRTVLEATCCLLLVVLLHQAQGAWQTCL